MQQYCSAPRQGKSYFIVKLLPWHNQNNNKKEPQGKKKNEARNYGLCKGGVSGCAIPF